MLIGTPAIATSSYLVAVDLAGDAHRPGKRTIERDFPVRALVTGLVAGPLAIAALAVVRADAPLIWTGLTGGAGLVMVCASASISSMEKRPADAGRTAWRRPSPRHRC